MISGNVRRETRAWAWRRARYAAGVTKTRIAEHALDACVRRVRLAIGGRVASYGWRFALKTKLASGPQCMRRRDIAKQKSGTPDRLRTFSRDSCCEQERRGRGRVRPSDRVRLAGVSWVTRLGSEGRVRPTDRKRSIGGFVIYRSGGRKFSTPDVSRTFDRNFTGGEIGIQNPGTPGRSSKLDRNSTLSGCWIRKVTDR